MVFDPKIVRSKGLDNVTILQRPPVKKVTVESPAADQPPPLPPVALPPPPVLPSSGPTEPSLARLWGDVRAWGAANQVVSRTSGQSMGRFLATSRPFAALPAEMKADLIDQILPAPNFAGKPYMSELAAFRHGLKPPDRSSR